eukprot:jgi/Mesvir1/4042/Mv25651-RA.1
MMSPLFTLVPALYAIALRHELFAPQPLITAGASCGSCGLALDTTGTHYMMHRVHGWPAKPELVPLSPYRSPPGGVCHGSVGLSPLHHQVRGRGWGRPLLTQPPPAPTLPCLTTTGRVATCSSMSPWLRRSPVATSSGRLWMPALLPLSVAERDKFASYGNVGPHRVIPFVLEEFGAMGPAHARQRSFSTSAASAVKTASTSRVRPAAPWSARTWSSYWRQRLSLALTRTVADVLFRRTRADFVATHAV